VVALRDGKNGEFLVGEAKKQGFGAGKKIGILFSELLEFSFPLG